MFKAVVFGVQVATWACSRNRARGDQVAHGWRSGSGLSGNALTLVSSLNGFDFSWLVSGPIGLFGSSLPWVAVRKLEVETRW